jgi:nitrate/TMAO reductase-like tetraheme cytochrome c subunit
MREVFEFFVHRWLRMIGGLMVFGSLALLIFLVLLDALAGISNLYIGIITYMVLPGLLFLGLILVPLDSLLRRRRAAAGHPDEAYCLTINFCDPKQRNLAYFFSLSTLVIVVVATVATYKGVEFMDTREFCGLTCHKVMKPELTAYQRSPHAGVLCVGCHIGPGAPWFVKAKLTGIPQTYHYTMKDYERPIPTPVAALRPSRDTCENCHRPERFYGASLRTKITYLPDSRNTMRTQTMLMKVGSGAVKGANIHSHIVNKIWYVPANEKRTEISWVRVQRVDGTTQEYVPAETKKTDRSTSGKQEKRFMDCIDCHNRTAHNFESYESLLDMGMTEGDVDRTIPYIKKEAVAAVPDLQGAPPTEAQQAEAVRSIESIPQVYKARYPDIYKSRSRDIAAATAKIKDIYLVSAFPHMRISATTYPNWATHEGCFRCHGNLVKADKRGEKLSNDCLLCHTLQETREDRREGLQ